MPITTVLFDLDGTLLPMDQEEFVKTYFTLLGRYMAQFGFEPKELLATIWQGTKMMMKNDGSRVNSDVFWDVLVEHYGEDKVKNTDLFDNFYHSEFMGVRNVCTFNTKAPETVKKIKDSGFRVALATQPIFPSIATQQRVKWAGLDAEDFELVTSYENIGFTKPVPEYYLEVCRRLSVEPSECLMVGNDVDDDMVTADLGMNVFLLTDCLINHSQKDISQYPHGSFEDLLSYLNI